MILYLAGPMSGVPDYNRPRFAQVERYLSNAGHDVRNPAATRLDGVPDSDWKSYMRAGLDLLLHKDVQGVALLAGWRDSTGANLEYKIAQAFGLEIKPWEEWTITKP